MNKQVYVEYHVQCISADFNWFEQFYMRNVLVQKYGEDFVNRWDAFAEYGSCIFEKNVFNLIIKRDISYKTTYDVFRSAVHSMAEIIKHNKDVKTLVIPLDLAENNGLSWMTVYSVIYDELKDVDVTVMIRDFIENLKWALDEREY